MTIKEIIWVGSCKKDFLRFPKEVRSEMGYALYVAQRGSMHESVKPFKGHSSGIYEVVNNYDTNAYRAVYVIKFGNKIYVLHAFQKKSKKGIKTPKEELTVIKERLKQLQSILRRFKT